MFSDYRDETFDHEVELSIRIDDIVLAILLPGVDL
jgi:hypothetical protein